MTVQIINQLITPAVLIIFALGFLTIGFQFRNFKSAHVFAASYIIAATAFMGELFIGNNAELSLARIIVDNLYMLSVSCSVVAFAMRSGKNAPIKLLFTIHIAALMIAGSIYIMMPDLIAKAYIISSACSFMMALALPLIRDEKNSERKMVDKILYWAVGVSALQLMINAATLLIVDKSLLLNNFEVEDGFIAIMNFSVVLISLTIALCLFISYGTEIVLKLKQKSDTDAMTGLLNKGAFESVVNHQIIIAEKTSMPLSLIVADIDFFKRVNDEHGHLVGDEVIKNFASVLSGSIRVMDHLGRVGGEEFCILLATANGGMAKMIAETARTTFEQGRYITTDDNQQLTASFGISEFIPGETYEDLFKRADEALYLSKENGRNRVTIGSGKSNQNETLLSA